VHIHVIVVVMPPVPEIPAPSRRGGTTPSSPAPLPCTGARARRLTRRLTAFYEQHLRACGLTLPQYSVLVNLSDAPQPLTRLAGALEMDRTTLTRSIAPLLARGWIAQRAGEDARQRLLVLTTDGARVRDRARRHWAQAQLALEAQLDRDFVQSLNAQLEQALSRLKPVLPRDN
jgi:DNA-binding MarR family transcriptional regulator